jgi:hypothetical protein
MKHEDAQVPPADAGRLETPVRPQRTEWEEIRMALRQEYGHPYSYRGQPLVDFSRHVYVGRACALLLMAEKQERALREAIATLERDGDEWGVCDRLRAALRPNDEVEPRRQASARTQG